MSSLISMSRVLVTFVLFLYSAASAPAGSLISNIPDFNEEDEEAAPHEEDVQYTEDGGGEIGWDDFYDGGGGFASMFGDEEEMFDGHEYMMDPEETQQAVTTLFGRFDTDSSKTLTAAGIRTALVEQAQRYSRWATKSAEEETRMLLSEHDEDGDGRLSRVEFDAAESLYLPHDSSLSRSDAFAFADASGGAADQHLELEELLLLLFPDASSRFAEFRAFLTRQVLQTNDHDGDGYLR